MSDFDQWPAPQDRDQLPPIKPVRLFAFLMFVALGLCAIFAITGFVARWFGGAR